jgi:hypothetical protein
MGKKRGVYRVLVGKTDEKRQLGRPRPRWDGNKKWNSGSRMGTWSGLIWLTIGTGGGIL